MLTSLIVAHDEDNVIGVNGALPWNLPAELRRFREVTMGRPVIMGRRTWESLGRRSLNGRLNIVVSTTLDGAARSLNEAWERAAATGAPEAFVIGGAALYALAVAHVGRAYVTRVHTRVDTSAAADVARFPWFALASRTARVVARYECPAAADNPFGWTQTVYAFAGAA